MDSKGVLIVHPKKQLIGKSTITDLQLTAFQPCSTTRTPMPRNS